MMKVRLAVSECLRPRVQNHCTLGLYSRELNNVPDLPATEGSPGTSLG
jgi:hypothetical protein